MTFTPIPAGTQNWDVPVNAAFTDQDSRISANVAANAATQTQLTVLNASTTVPSDVGFQAMTYPPEYAASTQTLTNNTIFMMRVNLPQAATLSGLSMACFANAVGAVAGQNFVGLYDGNGNQLAVSADQSTNWSTTGTKDMPFVTPIAAAPGFYYAAILPNATTAPGFLRSVATGVAANMINRSQSPSTAKWATAGTATSLPPFIDMTTRVLSGNSYFVGIF